IALLTTGNRAMHMDGLADTVDGLTASYGRERALEVMRASDVGPAGVVALVLVLLTQATALAAVAVRPYGWLLVGLSVCGSRAALSISCRRGVPSARPDGLGNAVA